MQTKNHKKEGFTLVELIVVIVVIAILTAILIPTIGYVIEHSKETADITTVKLLNLALVEDNAKNDAPETMTDVIKIMKSKGYLIDKITPRSSGDILWDSANNRFMLKKDDKILYQDKSTVKAEPYELWKVVETEKDGKVIENLQSVLKSDSYSHYLKGENFAQSLTVSTGLDVGENANIPSVSYNGNTKTQKVTIRTQGGSLSIDAGTDTVNHYGWVKELAVTAVATSDCYHEHGFVGKLVAFSSGRYIAAKGTIFHETKNEIETIIGSNEKELTKAKFGGHYYNANGVCVMEDCTGIDGHRATNDTHVHKYDENGACECGATKAGVKKDGLVNGYYYKDDELFTGETDGYEFKNGILVLKDELIIDTNVKGDSIYGIRTTTQNFDLSKISTQYLTRKFIIELTDVSCAKYTVTGSENYQISSAIAVTPFVDLLKKNGWNNTDVAKLINDRVRNEYFVNGYDYLIKKNAPIVYPEDLLNEYKLYVPFINLTSDFKAYMNLLGYTVENTDYSETNNAINEYINRANGVGNVLPLTYVQYLEMKYVNGYTISKNGDIYTAGRSASLTFDQNHIPESSGGANSIMVGGCYVALELDENGVPILNENGTGLGASDFLGAIFLTDSDGAITKLKCTALYNDVTINGIKAGFSSINKEFEIKDGKFEIIFSNNKTLTISVEKKGNTSRFIISYGTDIAEAFWTPLSIGPTLTTGADGKISFSSYNLTGNIVSKLSEAQKSEFIQGFVVGSNNDKSDYIHCELAVIEAYIKAMNDLSGVQIDNIIYKYNADGTVDITEAIKSHIRNGEINAVLPASQGSDLLYPNIQIIYEKKSKTN